VRDIGAFVAGQSVYIAGQADGVLAGLKFAVKDLFDVKGVPTGAGNHDWPFGRPLPIRHAWAVQALLDAGACFVGKTVTDEVSLGIFGENPFDGTPVNIKAPDRVPGGSSSGSAAAVAAGLCDTALGTDTGGSVRVPASFCGLYGIRPTHGRLELSGMLPQAPSSDTAGWFARDIKTFARVSSVLLQETIPAVLPNHLVIAYDCFGFADPEVAVALKPMVTRLSQIIGSSREDVMAPQGLSVWARAQRTLQSAEAFDTFKDWLDERNPRLAFSVARALVVGSMLPESERGWARLMRQEVKSRMAWLLPAGTVLCMPTTPFPAPRKGQRISILDQHRDRITCLCAQGGLAGHPQVNLPGATVDGLPVGLSIIGPRGSDAMLVALAQAMAWNF